MKTSVRQVLGGGGYKGLKRFKYCCEYIFVCTKKTCFSLQTHKQNIPFCKDTFVCSAVF